MTPEQKLLKYYKENKNDIDGGGANAMVQFAKDCFDELKALGDKAKVRDVHKYLVAVHDVTVNRMEKQTRQLINEIEKLHKD